MDVRLFLEMKLMGLFLWVRVCLFGCVILRLIIVLMMVLSGPVDGLIISILRLLVWLRTLLRLSPVIRVLLNMRRVLSVVW